jgi:ABC-type polar amino acid transport system ATPase subunit
MALETLGSTRNKKTADAQPAVRISGLRKSFDGRLVLGGIDLDVPVGRIVSIIGQSGGGKTTLMRCVNLLERPDGGSIAIGDETIFADGGVTCRDLAKLRQRVGMVFQRFNLFPHLTAVENVVLAQMHAAAIGEREAVERAVRLLTRVGLARRAMAYPERMSGGEQQRVAIARAIVGNPSVVLADEPTAALDGENGRAIMKILAEIAKEPGRAVLIVTHDPRLLQFADRVVHIEDGRITGEEPGGGITQ